MTKENNRLREAVLVLQRDLERSESRKAELEAALRQAASASQAVQPDIAEVTPYVVEVSIGRLSHARDEDGDGLVDTLRLYLHPSDGLGRFTQLVGTIAVNAAVLPADADAMTIGRFTAMPQQVRDAYRSGITGTHYVFSIPVQLPEQKVEAPECTVQVIYTDGTTGAQVTAQGVIKLTVDG